MTGGFRLLWVLVCSLLLFAALWGANGPTVTTTAGPPKAKPEPVEDTLHGHKIVDPYRYLENASSPETQEYVRDEMAYTRSLLDPLPGRDKIHARLEQLLTIGNITTPQLGGNYYFYTRRDGGWQMTPPDGWITLIHATDDSTRCIVAGGIMYGVFIDEVTNRAGPLGAFTTATG